MQITAAALRALGQGFQSAFLQGLDGVQPQWPLVAMEVNSTTAMEHYGWMKQIPGVREWVGQRVINNLEALDYLLKNKSWEHTIGIDRNDIEDDKLGVYKLAFSQQGEIVAAHPDMLVWQTLLAGFATKGMDGQYFFDTDHIGYSATGAEASYSNYASGSGSPWFLMDLSRSYMKPLVMQWRKRPEFVTKTALTDDNVFFNREFIYGMDARYNVGFGFHQLAYAGKNTLDAAAFEAGLLAMTTQYRPDGQVLNVKPTHLVIGPSNRAAAKALIQAEKLASGATNINYQAVELVIVNALG